MPDLSHLWQRFVLASALVFGLLLGVVATVFGYSNTASVDVSWSIFRLDGVPLWTVAVVPLVLVLVAGTVYHWFNSLHHFTEHMRHRHRVHELEAELARLRGHLDQVLEMPDGSPSKPALTAVESETPPAGTPALPDAAASNGGVKSTRRAAHRKTVALDTETVAEPAAEKPAEASEPTEPAEAAAEPLPPVAVGTTSTPATADV